jgi:hypothetical protein
MYKLDLKHKWLLLIYHIEVGNTPKTKGKIKRYVEILPVKTKSLAKIYVKHLGIEALPPRKGYEFGELLYDIVSIKEFIQRPNSDKEEWEHMRNCALRGLGKLHTCVK